MEQPSKPSTRVSARREPPVRKPVRAAQDADERPKLPPRRQQGPWMRRVLVFATCVLLLDALFGERGLAETMRARQVVEEAEAGLLRLKQENAGLREQIRRLQEDPATIESVARAELGMIRPGEILVVIKDLD